MDSEMPYFLVWSLCIILVLSLVFLMQSLYVTRSGKRYHSVQKIFFELYILRECTRRALRNDASCSKIVCSVLELYTEIFELSKTD